MSLFDKFDRFVLSPYYWPILIVSFLLLLIITVRDGYRHQRQVDELRQCRQQLNSLTK